MGTNYYVHIPPSCGGKCETHCRGGEIHLGKSSAGWAFAFRAYPDPAAAPELVTWPVTDFASWRKLLGLGKIVDEYGHPFSATDLERKIEAKRGEFAALHASLGDFLDDADNRFIPTEFS